MYRLFLTLFCGFALGIGQNLYAQNTKPILRIVTDSVYLGTPIRMSLSYTHNQFEEVIFPDSSYNFSPFEWVRKNYVSTRTKGMNSTDSACYELRTFNMDTIQSIALPVFLIDENGDTTRTLSNEVSVKLSFIVNTDSLNKVSQNVQQNIKSNTAYAKLKRLPQSVLYVLAVLGVLLLVGSVFLLFNKNIRRAYQIRRLRRQYERFKQDFENVTRQEKTSKTTESALLLWKTFLEKLEEKPFTSYTSKEILTVLSDDSLVEPLKNLDRAIYGSMINENTQTALDFLKNYAANIYDHKMTEVQNA